MTASQDGAPCVSCGRYALCISAYNVPVLPLLIAQNAFDERYDAKYSASTAYTFRVVVAFVTLSCGLAVVPFAGQLLLLV